MASDCDHGRLTARPHTRCHRYPRRVVLIGHEIPTPEFRLGTTSRFCRDSAGDPFNAKQPVAANHKIPAIAALSAIFNPVDRDAWESLFRAYRDFYELDGSDDVIDTVWGCLHHPEHEVNGPVATDADTIVGFAHYRRVARPSTGTTGLWLDDLFTAPDQRGQGVGRDWVTTMPRFQRRGYGALVGRQTD